MADGPEQTLCRELGKGVTIVTVNELKVKILGIAVQRLRSIMPVMIVPHTLKVSSSFQV